MRASLTLLVAVLAACDHTTPAGYPGPDPLGPFQASLPRRLTFSQGDDRTPAVIGGTLVFSRLEAADAGTRERCLAWLPVEGGRIWREACPPLQQAAADSFVDTWVEPALSPGGDRVAYVWQEGSLVSVLGFHRARLIVAPVSDPADTGGYAREISISTSSGEIANSAIALSWASATTVRFLGTYEYIFKVKGGGLERYTDTTFQSLALMELDLPTGVLRVVPGGDSAIAYSAAPDGGVWLVKSAAPATLMHLASGADTVVAVGSFSTGVEDLVAVDGLAVAALAGGAGVEALDPASGGRITLGPFTGRTHRVSAASGRRLVVEVERDTTLFGAPANLWLLEIP
jgi:hypothetical protein